jgi:hypothetical protein
MMDIESLAGLVLIVGTALVYVGFSIFPSRIYTATDIDLKVGLVDMYTARWNISQAMVILGSTTSVIGLSAVTGRLLGTAGASLALVGLAAVAIGGILWDWHLVMRILNPQGFAHGELLYWPFLIYSILTPIGLAAYGVAFWLGGTDLVLEASLLAGATIVLGLEYVPKDMPPFVHYAMTLIVGLVLFL